VGARQASALESARGFIFDVDGTLVLADDPNIGGGMRPLPGACELLRRLRAAALPFVCFTNGTGQVPAAQAARLRQLGLDVEDEQLLTPAVVAATYIRQHHAGECVLAFGNEGIFGPLCDAGVETAALGQAEQAGVVLVGADPEFTYDKLVAACRAVWHGAPLLVTSMAPWFASRNGRMPSTSGAIVAGITHVTGVQPIIVGKPSAVAMQVLANALGLSPDEVAVVGDDVHLEIRMGRDAGALTALVLTGSTRREALDTIDAAHQPHAVLSTLEELQ
jgi:4-nitrophenyl phosphatase